MEASSSGSLVSYCCRRQRGRCCLLSHQRGRDEDLAQAQGKNQIIHVNERRHHVEEPTHHHQRTKPNVHDTRGHARQKQQHMKPTSNLDRVGENKPSPLSAPQFFKSNPKSRSRPSSMFCRLSPRSCKSPAKLFVVVHFLVAAAAWTLLSQPKLVASNNTPPSAQTIEGESFCLLHPYENN